MADPTQTSRFRFPRWANYLLPLIVVSVVGGGLYVPVVVGLGFSPQTTDVGYMPEQPVPYSHQLHVGKLGMDCRYCHNTVDRADFAAIPATQTCMNCHTNIQTENNTLAPVRESWQTGEPIPWVKVHDLPDYAYFSHQAHVNRGVSCVSCHGRVDQMEVVWQDQPLNMGWCLDCHRAPEKFLRPTDTVTQMGWNVAMLADTHPDIEAAIRKETGVSKVTQKELGEFLKKEYKIKDKQYMESCSTCHR